MSEKERKIDKKRNEKNRDVKKKALVSKSKLGYYLSSTCKSVVLNLAPPPRQKNDFLWFEIHI